jgi:aspartate aminotransferase
MNQKPTTTRAAGCDQSPHVQLNLNVRGLRPSATVAINERSDRLRRQGRQIFKMGLGQCPAPSAKSV